MRRFFIVLIALLLLVPAVSRADTWINGEPFPDVIAVKVTPAGKDAFTFHVTVVSRYDTPQRYADGFRVTDAKGAVLGELKLAHDHAGEQPFTRELAGVKIPRGIRAVTVQARDQLGGYGGKSFEAALPGR